MAEAQARRSRSKQRSERKPGTPLERRRTCRPCIPYINPNSKMFRSHFDDSLDPRLKLNIANSMTFEEILARHNIGSRQLLLISGRRFQRRTPPRSYADYYRSERDCNMDHFYRPSTSRYRRESSVREFFRHESPKRHHARRAHHSHRKGSSKSSGRFSKHRSNGRGSRSSRRHIHGSRTKRDSSGKRFHRHHSSRRRRESGSPISSTVEKRYKPEACRPKASDDLENILSSDAPPIRISRNRSSPPSVQPTASNKSCCKIPESPVARKFSHSPVCTKTSPQEIIRPGVRGISNRISRSPCPWIRQQPNDGDDTYHKRRVYPPRTFSRSLNESKDAIPPGRYRKKSPPNHHQQKARVRGSTLSRSHVSRYNSPRRHTSKSIELSVLPKCSPLSTKILDKLIRDSLEAKACSDKQGPPPEFDETVKNHVGWSSHRNIYVGTQLDSNVNPKNGNAFSSPRNKNDEENYKSETTSVKNAKSHAKSDLSKRDKKMKADNDSALSQMASFEKFKNQHCRENSKALDNTEELEVKLPEIFEVQNESSEDQNSDCVSIQTLSRSASPPGPQHEQEKNRKSRDIPTWRYPRCGYSRSILFGFAYFWKALRLYSPT